MSPIGTSLLTIKWGVRSFYIINCFIEMNNWTTVYR